MERDGRHFPNRLKKYRRIRGYSQSEVAKLLGFKASTAIYEWEKGITVPSLKNLFKLSIIYHTLVEELYGDFFKSIRYDLNKHNTKTNNPPYSFER